MESTPRRIVVVGGGTAGWMAAAALVSMLPPSRASITLVESEAIGIIGVGEATLPHLRHFNETIGINEADFIAATSATLKLGIEFVNWSRQGDRYIHPFGDFGRAVDGIPFHQVWNAVRAKSGGQPIGAYSLPVRMCQAARFDRPSDDAESIASTYGYAYQFDATRYAPFLQQHALARGATRIEGLVDAVNQDPETGDIRSLKLQDGRTVEGDFFFDCTGFGGLLIERTLQAGHEDWSHWLPCDRALAVPCESVGDLLPFTRATAQEAGWQWRIPLQHRTGNGHVFSSRFTDEDRARQTLLDNLDGPILAEPRLLRFATGRRRVSWSHNCVAAGLSGGFLEPLESTSIHLIQMAITHFIELFPVSGDYALERETYNTIMKREFERVRDFLILHYHATERQDSAFWNYVRTMPIPDSLTEKMELFRARGHVARYQQGLFLEPSWIAVYLGQRILPDSWDVRLETMPVEELKQALGRIDGEITAALDRMPPHAAWIESLTAASAGSTHA